jgi:hypothetical protein
VAHDKTSTSFLMPSVTGLFEAEEHLYNIYAPCVDLALSSSQ